MDMEALQSWKKVKVFEHCPAVLRGFKMVFSLPGLPFVEPGFGGLCRQEDEEVHEVNAWNIAKELNSYDALGIRLHSREQDDEEALRIFNSRFHYDGSGHPCVGFPWVRGLPPTSDHLASNFGLVKARFESLMNFVNR